MERIEKSVEVKAPVKAVYNQWTQFEEFPRFMAGVKEVKQLDDTHVHWHAEIWGKDKEWTRRSPSRCPIARSRGAASRATPRMRAKCASSPWAQTARACISPWRTSLRA